MPGQPDLGCSVKTSFFFFATTPNAVPQYYKYYTLHACFCRVPGVIAGGRGPVRAGWWESSLRLCTFSIFSFFFFSTVVLTCLLNSQYEQLQVSQLRTSLSERRRGKYKFLVFSRCLRACVCACPLPRPIGRRQRASVPTETCQPGARESWLKPTGSGGERGEKKGEEPLFGPMGFVLPRLFTFWHKVISSV